MTLYAASNLAEITVPSNGDLGGGCGVPHRRPYVNGAPQHPWALTCQPCEDFLRVHNSDQWSGTIAEIPETHDEKIQREDFEKRGARDKDNVLALAIAKLAGVEVPESMQRMVSGLPAHIPVEIVCPAGHGQPPGMKFCGECGAPMQGPVAKAAIQAAPADGEQQVKVPRMRDGTLDVLRAFARANDLDGDGTRKDLIGRLADAGLTGKWAAFARDYQAAAAA